MPFVYLAFAVIIALAVVLLVLMRLTRRVAKRAEAAVPPDGKFIDIGGDRLHYVDIGSGPPIVFVHGLCGQMRNFAYLPMATLARDHRVILLDRPGAGYSTRGATSSASVSAQAQTVVDFMSALGLEQPLLVGHSLGGAIALAVALDHPSAVSGIGLIAPLTHGVAAPPKAFAPLAVRSDALRRFISLTLAVPVGMMTGRTTLAAVFGPDRAPDDFLIRGGGVLGFRPGNFYAASQDLLAVEHDMAPQALRYPQLTVPVDVLYGRQDRILNYRAHGEALRDAYPATRLMLVDGGHMLPVTLPEITMQWLRDTAARSQPVAPATVSTYAANDTA